MRKQVVVRDEMNDGSLRVIGNKSETKEETVDRHSVAFALSPSMHRTSYRATIWNHYVPISLMSADRANCMEKREECAICHREMFGHLYS